MILIDFDILYKTLQIELKSFLSKLTGMLIEVTEKIVHYKSKV